MNDFPTPSNLVKTILKRRPPSAPYRATIDLTTACNFHCEFCWFHATDNRRPPRPEHADTTQILSIIKELAKMGTKSICLSGSGEPVNHPAFPEIVDTIKDARMSLKIITNLSASSQRIKTAYTRADHLMVNLSATSEEDYTAIHSPPHAKIFNQVRNNILSIAQSRHLGSPYLEISYVLTKNNFRNIEKAVQMARAYRASAICFKHLQATPFSQNLALGRPEKKELLLNIARLLKQPLGIQTNLREIIRTFRPLAHNTTTANRCFIGWFNIKIRQNGAVGLCCLNNKLKIGHWNKDPIKTIWAHPKTHQLRLLAQNHIHLKKINGADCFYCPYATLNSQIEAELAKHGSVAQ